MGESSPARLRGIDAARGLALLGMLAVHLLPSRDDDGAISLSYRLASGRAAATFAVLAGVGLALATRRSAAAGRAGRAGVAAPVAVRALAIGALGLALGYPGSGVEVILPYYGLFFLLAIPLLRLSPRALALLALAAALLVPPASHLLREHLAVAPPTNPTFGTLVQDPAGLLLELTLTGFYPVLAWMTYLCAGLAVGRLPLQSPRVAAWLLLGGLLLASLAATCSAVLLGPLGGRDHVAATLAGGFNAADLDRLLSEARQGTTPTTTWWWLSVDAPHSSTPEDLLETTGVAVAVVGASLLAANWARPALLPLAAAGGMTLTVYTGQVLSMASPVQPLSPVARFAAEAAGAVGFALAWRRLVGLRGPLGGGRGRPGGQGETGGRTAATTVTGRCDRVGPLPECVR